MSEQVEELKRELRGVTEMLAAVLETVGEPVRVTKKSLEKLSTNRQIVIDEDMASDTFIFHMEDTE